MNRSKGFIWRNFRRQTPRRRSASVGARSSHHQRHPPCPHQQHWYRKRCQRPQGVARSPSMPTESLSTPTEYAAGGAGGEGGEGDAGDAADAGLESAQPCPLLSRLVKQWRKLPHRCLQLRFKPRARYLTRHRWHYKSHRCLSSNATWRHLRRRSSTCRFHSRRCRRSRRSRHSGHSHSNRHSHSSRHSLSNRHSHSSRHSLSCRHSLSSHHSLSCRHSLSSLHTRHKLSSSPSDHLSHRLNLALRRSLTPSSIRSTTTSCWTHRLLLCLVNQLSARCSMTSWRRR